MLINFSQLSQSANLTLYYCDRSVFLALSHFICWDTSSMICLCTWCRVRHVLLCIFPKTQCSTDVYIQTANDSELWNLNTVVQNRVVFLRNTFFLFSK